MTSRSFVRHLGLRSSLLVLAVAAGSCAGPSTGEDPTESEPSPDESLGEAEQAVAPVQNVFNVYYHGADPADFTDDTAAIKAAINAAVLSGGGTVYFPRGEYDITDSLVLPRSLSKPLVFQGEGRALTRITTAGNLPSDKPVVTFSGTATAKEFAFRDLMIGRTDPGPVFYHDQPTPGTTLWKATFERVFFAAPDDSDGLAPGVPSFDLVHLRGAVLCRMEDVVFNGGNTALRLEDSAYVELRHLNTEQDLQTNHGVALVGGTGHSIYHSLLGATDGGASLSIEGGTYGISNIQVDGLSGGGKRTQSFVKLAGTSAAPVKNVILKNVNIPGPWGPAYGVSGPAYGIHVNDWVRDVHVLNGSAATWAANLPAGGRIVFVEDGAKNILVEKLLYVDPIENGGLGDYVAVEPGATRVHVELVDSSFDKWVRDEGMTSSWSATGGTAYVGADATVVADLNTGSYITKILQRKGSALVETAPQKGQRVLLLGSVAAPVVAAAPGGNLKLSYSPFTLEPDTVLQLVYDGTYWQEVSRSAN